MITHPSVCPLDCPDTCSLSVTVEDGVVTGVRGSKANPLTDGVLCAKVARDFPRWVHGPNRLRTPLRRVGPRGEGRFEPISWTEAIDEIHERFQAVIATHGPQAVMPLNYAGPHGMLASASMDLRFFHRLGATMLDRVPLCGGIRSAAWRGTFGGIPGMPPEQVPLAQLVVVWGNNVTACNLHLAPLIAQARKAGAKLVVVDPRRTPIAEKADLHLAIRPGTDAVLAFAVAVALERFGALDWDFLAEHVLGADAFLEAAQPYPPEVAAEICGVTQEEIKELAALYATRSPAAISVGNGLERNQNGGAGIRAILALPALAGKFGVPGGGLVNGASSAFPKTAERLARADLAPPGTRTFNIVDVGAHLLDSTLSPPVQAVFIYNHNPLVVHPEQNRLRRGLMREDLFLVGCDVVMTDSMALCDVVLPASSHFEYPDVYAAYGQHWLQRAEAVIPRVGDSLPNTEIFRRLCRRFGFTGPLFEASDEALMNEALDATDPRLGGVLPSQLPLDHATPMRFDGEEAVMFRNVFPKTPSGKVELLSETLDQKYGQPVAQYQPVTPVLPLTLISPASDRRITSTFGELHASDAVSLEMHPDDAAARGLEHGATVRVYNALGEVFLPLTVTERVRPGVVCSFKGAWMRTCRNGQTVSALAPATHADLAFGACYNDTRVEVAPAAGP